MFISKTIHMKSHYKPQFIASLLGISLLVGCRKGPDRSRFKAVDANGDGKIQKREFQTDHRQNGYHKTWDENQNQRIGKAEWNSGLKQYFTGLDYGPALFEDWQLDADRRTISPQELALGLFQVYDQNGDGVISPQEYAAYPGTEG